QGYPYIKRFNFEPSARKQRFLGENDASTLIALSDKAGAMFRVTFGAPDDFRDPMIVDAEEFIGLKSFRARGKRLTTWTLGSVEELEPKQAADDGGDDTPAGPQTAPADGSDSEDVSTPAPDCSDDEVRDELTGQQRLF
ncbi:MAG: DNA gyrase/topoisomerase IV subunit A, partial [Muribaculaceae bacterium]|nr:DNA gyrase/topoisomerase IV subunit A [Muribaculaceae bacterium]